MQTKLISPLSLYTRIIRVSTSIAQLQNGGILNVILSIGFMLCYDNQNIFFLNRV
jgi:hypothetical protein